jgi:periplasmic iron binding protein
MVTGLIVIGVVAILAFNFQPGRDPLVKPPAADAKAEQTPVARAIGANLPENPIGDPVVKNHVQVAAVWLSGVTMAGMTSAPDVIHLEADIKSTEDNPNGFAKDEFVPYLKVAYSLVDASTGAQISSGEMSPMIASDGLHYGASVAMPKPGKYRLVYRIDPPSAGGLGRHVGAGGVAAWWEPFDASFDWTVEPPARPALAGVR